LFDSSIFSFEVTFLLIKAEAEKRVYIGEKAEIAKKIVQRFYCKIEPKLVFQETYQYLQCLFN